MTDQQSDSGTAVMLHPLNWPGIQAAREQLAYVVEEHGWPEILGAFDALVARVEHYEGIATADQDSPE